MIGRNLATAILKIELFEFTRPGIAVMRTLAVNAGETKQFSHLAGILKPDILSAVDYRPEEFFTFCHRMLLPAIAQFKY